MGRRRPVCRRSCRRYPYRGTGHDDMPGAALRHGHDRFTTWGTEPLRRRVLVLQARVVGSSPFPGFSGSNRRRVSAVGRLPTADLGDVDHEHRTRRAVLAVLPVLAAQKVDHLLARGATVDHTAPP